MSVTSVMVRAPPDTLLERCQRLHRALSIHPLTIGLIDLKDLRRDRRHLEAVANRLRVVPHLLARGLGKVVGEAFT